MAYTKVDVVKPGSNLGVGGNKKAEIVIFDMDDVLTFPGRDANGVVTAGNIVFKPGAYMIKVYATQNTIEAGHKGEGDTDKKGYIQNVKFEHPGDTVAILEFDANWLNRNVGILIQRCADTRKTLFGTPCAPLQMVTEHKDTKDTNTTEFTFASAQKGPIESDYQGTMALSAVTGTVAAAAVAVDVTNGPGQYQLTTGVATAAVIASIINAVDGYTYTLLGSGGAWPSTVPPGTLFLLASGATWTAIAGATLTLKTFKDTGATFKFLEVSRS